MANALYPKFLEALLQAGINLSTDAVKVALVDTASYAYSASHQYFSAVSAAVVGTPQPLTGKTVTNGRFDAADVTFPAVSGPTCEALVLYKDTGNAATSPLIAYIDTGVTNLPVVPNGGDINAVWDNANGYIFKL